MFLTPKFGGGGPIEQQKKALCFFSSMSKSKTTTSTTHTQTQTAFKSDANIDLLHFHESGKKTACQCLQPTMGELID